jgi:hypothetical protein
VASIEAVCRENGGVLLTAVGLADGELVPDEVGAILNLFGNAVLDRNSNLVKKKMIV